MPRCTAKNRRGEPCRRDAIQGGNVCNTHGGAAAQVKAAAKLRLAALVDPAIGTLDFAMKQKSKKLREALTAAKDVLDRSPELAAVHRFEDVTPADKLPQAERLKRLEELRAKLFKSEAETVQ